MVVAIVDSERVRAVASVISAAGVDGILRLEEALDPQYDDMQRLAERVGRGPATVYALLVALSSYRLTMRGEEWWQCVSDMLGDRGAPRSINEAIDNVVWFLSNCPGSLIGRDIKIRRVRRVGIHMKDLLERIMAQPQLVIERPQEILSSVAASLGSKEARKTVAFSVKMAYYAARARGIMRPLVFDLPMPIDVRVACVTLTSGLVRGPRDYHELVRSPAEAQRAWRDVSLMSGVPTPHLDSLLWVVGWAPRDLDQSAAREEIRRALSKVIPDAAEAIARELTYLPCPSGGGLRRH